MWEGNITLNVFEKAILRPLTVKASCMSVYYVYLMYAHTHMPYKYTIRSQKWSCASSMIPANYDKGHWQDLPTGKKWQ